MCIIPSYYLKNEKANKKLMIWRILRFSCPHEKILIVETREKSFESVNFKLK